MYAVMKAMTWDAMDTELFKFQTPPTGIGEPQRFIPLFELREDALIFAKGEERLIAEFKTVKPDLTAEELRLGRSK